MRSYWRAWRGPRPRQRQPQPSSGGGSGGGGDSRRAEQAGLRCSRTAGCSPDEVAMRGAAQTRSGRGSALQELTRMCCYPFLRCLTAIYGSWSLLIRSAAPPEQRRGGGGGGAAGLNPTPRSRLSWAVDNP